MTFETVPGWGLRPDGKSALGPTHGGVVVDKDRNVYVSADKGVVVFSPDGKVIRSYEGKKYARMHDIEIRDEDGTEYIYGARNANAEGLKFNARTGEIVMNLPLPAEESGLGKIKFNPTAITVAPNGDIFLSNGYATNHIFKFDKTGVDQEGRAKGRFVCTGVRPKCMDKLESMGIKLPASIFRERVMMED